METVLTAPRENVTQVDLSEIRPGSLPTRQKKKSIISSNGSHPTKAFIPPQSNADVNNILWECDGWRYVEKPSKNGRVRYERIPLTNYELLHPQEDYVIVHKSPHDANTERIGNSTKIHLANTPDVMVFGDLRTDFNLSGVEPMSPDISVVFGVSKDRIWSTFKCQEEGVYPSVIFEVTSPGTRTNDLEKKYDYYRQAGIPYYVILDIQYGWDGPNETANYHLHVFEYVRGQYEEVRANTEGRYWLPPLNMWVGVGDEGILFYDEAEMLLPNPIELKQTLNETEQRANEQERLAQEEATRAAEQKQLAQEEATRAAEQKQLAQKEAARAAEQVRLAQEADARAAEQEKLAQKEAARAAEQERLAQAALQAQLAAEAKVAELLAQMAELQAKSE